MVVSLDLFCVHLCLIFEAIELSILPFQATYCMHNDVKVKGGSMDTSQSGVFAYTIKIKK